MQGNTPNNQIESKSNTQTNELQVLTLTWKTGQKINLYIDGVLNESSANILNSAMSGVQKILLGKGGKDTGSSLGWDGRIGTVIFYNKKMSPDSVSLISGDLKAINSVQSGNWNNKNTWDCNCIPPANAFAKINNSHIVTLTGNTTANNLIIATGGSLDVSTNNYQLNLKRNLTVNGTIIPHQGEIRMNGTDIQLIDGTAKKELYNLTINNNNGVKLLNGAAEISGTLDIQAGCFETSNRITFISNATRTSRLAPISGLACITGNFTLQRYIDAGSTDWRFITSPINGATLADMNDDFITSGFTGSNFPNWPTPSNPWPSIYSYDETQLGIQDNGFNPATNTTNPMPVGAGFWVWSGDTIIGTQPFTIDISGPPNVGTINLPVTYTNSGLPSEDGWNMVGNPYPSTLDWDSPNISKTNINNAIYIWNPDLQQFGSYSGGIGINGASKNIASSQAFWVQANAPGAAVQVTELSKTSVDGAFLKQTTTNPLKISVQNNFGTDEMALNFESSSTNGYDVMYDAYKMVSVNTNIPNISSVMNNKDYSINQLPSQEINIPIKMLTGANGLHYINFENAANFGNAGCLILEDLFTGNSYNLNNVGTITTYLYDTTTIARFLLHIGAPVDISINNSSCFNTTDAKIVYNKNSATPFDITWKNSLNNIISTSNNIINADSISNLAGGAYYIETTDALCGNKIDTVTISVPAQITSYFSTVTDTVILGNSFTPNNISTNATSYLWSFGDGNTSTLVNPIHNFALPGNYTVNLTATQNNNCFENYSKLITVTNVITGISDLTANGIKTYINNDLLTIELINSSYNTVMVRSILGQTIFTSSINNNVITVNLSEFSSAFYIVTLLGDNNLTETFKIAYNK